jgi:hypothetical protein
VHHDPLTQHELLGALSGRVVHTLSNYMLAVSGNLWVVNSPHANQQDQTAALEGLKEAVRRSADLLDQFSAAAQSMLAESPRAPLSEIITHLKTWRANWPLTIADALPETSASLVGPWKWLKFALDTIAEEYAAESGAIKIDLAKDTRGIRPLRGQKPTSVIAIDLIAFEAQPIHWDTHRITLRNCKLTAAYELISQLGGRPETHKTETNLQRTTITLPLV